MRKSFFSLLTKLETSKENGKNRGRAKLGILYEGNNEASKWNMIIGKKKRRMKKKKKQKMVCRDYIHIHFEKASQKETIERQREKHFPKKLFSIIENVK